MFRTASFRFVRVALVSAALLLPGATSALSQDEALTLEPSKMVLTMADGSESVEYSVGDVSFYTSELAGVDGAATTTDLSLSISTISPLDENLLQWASNTGDAAVRKVALTSPTGLEGEIAEIMYEFEGARVLSVSLTHSTYSPTSVSMQIVSDQMTLNGIVID